MLTASPEEDVKASMAWLDAINPRHMPSTFKSMYFFMGSYHRIASLTRMVARKMSLPCKRPGRVDVEEFCKDTRTIWRGVRDLYNEINTKVEDVLSYAKEQILGFSPVHVSHETMFPADNEAILQSSTRDDLHPPPHAAGHSAAARLPQAPP
jgi:hypothetical protein